MASERIKVGNVEILALSDCTAEIDVCTFFPGKERNHLEPYEGYLEEDCKLRGGINIGSYLIYSQGQRILVDTGIGPVSPQGFVGGPGHLVEEMAQRGIKPEDVDVVMATHMHFDHIGWHVTMHDGKPTATFPRARYLIPAQDWELLLQPDKAMAGNRGEPYSSAAGEAFSRSSNFARGLSQLSNVVLIRGEHKISGEVTTVPTPGHTPGHQSVLVTSQGERAFILGDVAHLAMQLHEPEWIAAADVQPELGRKTRSQTVRRLEREGTLVAAGHFPAPGFGRIVRGDRGRYWQPL